MRNKKFVLDANIWVSYFVSNNFLILIQFVSLKKIQLLYSIELLQEVERVLQYPHLKKRNLDVKKSLEFIKSIGTLCLITYPIK
jgi:putative PIN family toxin of toxin-antitoxin system